MRRNRRTRSTLLGAAFAGAAFAALPATGANLIDNGSFGSGLGGWTAAPSVSWAPEGATSPGAARLGGSPGVVGALALAQCVAVGPGADYDLRATALLPYSPQAEGGVSVRVVWHAADACTGEMLGMAGALDFPPIAPAAWTRRGLERLRTPSNARSARLSVVPWAAGAPGAFAAFLDDVELVPSPRFETLVAPTAASVDGARGERFRTTLTVTNPSPFGRRVDATLRCAASDPCPSASVSLVFGAGETRVFPDALADLFGRRSGAGAIELTYDATLGPVLAAARAATVHAARPGNGMSIPVLPRRAATRTATFVALSDGRAGDGGTRVNAGVYNPSEFPVWVGFGVRDEAGAEKNAAYLYVAPRAWAQVNDLFGATATGPVRPGSTVTFNAESAVFPFLISIDNRSGDPTFLEPMESFQP